MGLFIYICVCIYIYVKKSFVTVFVGTHVFIFLGNIPESGIAESWGNSRFNSLKNYQTAFQTVFIFPSSDVSDAKQVPRLL